MTIDYGFTNSDEVQLDSQGLPIGTYKAIITAEEADPKGRGIIVTFEAVDGANKGASGRVWYMVKHENAQTANIAKQNLKRIADATGKPVSATSPLKGRVLTVEVRQQKKNPEYTEIFKYHPEDYTPVVDFDVPL